jgi:hypothetical protein
MQSCSRQQLFKWAGQSLELLTCGPNIGTVERSDSVVIWQEHRANYNQRRRLKYQ